MVMCLKCRTGLTPDCLAGMVSSRWGALSLRSVAGLSEALRETGASKPLPHGSGECMEAKCITRFNCSGSIGQAKEALPSTDSVKRC